MFLTPKIGTHDFESLTIPTCTVTWFASMITESVFTSNDGDDTLEFSVVTARGGICHPCYVGPALPCDRSSSTWDRLS